MEWKTKLAEKSKPLTDFLFFLAKRAQNDMIFRVASSLAYTSLIALVPLFAIGLAIFSAFPVFEAVRSQVEEFIFQNLTPEFEQEVSSYFAAIVKNAGRPPSASSVSPSPPFCCCRRSKTVSTLFSR